MVETERGWPNPQLENSSSSGCLDMSHSKEWKPLRKHRLYAQ